MFLIYHFDIQPFCCRRDAGVVHYMGWHLVVVLNMPDFGAGDYSVKKCSFPHVLFNILE